MPEKKLSRREREKRRQRQEMLDAALDLFAEKGYHNVSINEIAVRSEFAIGTIYKLFKNKEDLYNTLFRELAEKFHDNLEKALRQGDDEVSKLQNYIRVKSEMFKSNQQAIRMYFAETRGAGFNVKTRLDDEVRQRYNQFMHKIAALFESGMQKKRFKRIADPYYLAVALDGIANAFLFLLVEEPEQYPYPEDDSVILDIFFKGLLNS
jgi:AcrR family transcriptional regulator